MCADCILCFSATSSRWRSLCWPSNGSALRRSRSTCAASTARAPLSRDRTSGDPVPVSGIYSSVFSFLLKLTCAVPVCILCAAAGMPGSPEGGQPGWDFPPSAIPAPLSGAGIGYGVRAPPVPPNQAPSRPTHWKSAGASRREQAAELSDIE